MKRQWLASLLGGVGWICLLTVGVPALGESGDGQPPVERTTESLGAEISTSGPLTVEGAIDEGLHRSPEILRAKAALKEKSWHRFGVLGTGFLPKVSISALHYFDTQYAVTAVNFGGGNLVFPGFFPQTQASLDVSLPIFDGLSNVRLLQAANLEEDAAEQDLAQSEFRLTEEIRVAFYQALAASQLQAVAQENVTTLEDHLKQVRIQKQGGVATNYDNLRVEVQLSEARADAIDSEDNATLTRKKLALLMGLRRDSRALQGDLPVPDPVRVKALELTDVPVERHDIQALNLRAQAADRTDSARSWWMIPSISLAGQYSIYDEQFFNNVVINTGNYQNAYNVGVFLKWNLFDGGASLAQGKEAAYQSLQADKSAELAKLQIPYDFAYWKRRYLSNSDHYLSKKFDITRSEESVRLAKAEEKAGTRTSTETLDAELDLFRARAGVVNAQVNAAEALIRLELALGRRI
jgi:outer membrane protein TolC